MRKWTRAFRVVGVGVLAVLLVATVAAVIVLRVQQAHAYSRQMRAAKVELEGVTHSRYSATGAYVKPPVTNIQGKITLAANGLPVVHYGGSIGTQTNPVTTAQYGLYEYGVYLRYHSPRSRAAVLRVADWFVKTQTRDGLWLERFDFSYDGWKLHAPWACALAQGQAMSLLERAYRMTGDRRYLRAAVHALRPLTRDVNRGGLRRCFHGDCALPFFEEYPTDPPSYVLNGFMFTLVGLYDLASVAPQTAATSLYQAGRRTLTVVLPLYDRDGKAVYELFHPHLASPGYQVIHIYLLRALDSVHHDALLERFETRWSAQFGVNAQGQTIS